MDWIEIVSELGFPIAISIYLLLRIERALIDLKEKVEQAIEEKDQT